MRRGQPGIPWRTGVGCAMLQHVWDGLLRKACCSACGAAMDISGGSSAEADVSFVGVGEVRAHLWGSGRRHWLRRGCHAEAEWTPGHACESPKLQLEVQQGRDFAWPRICCC